MKKIDKLVITSFLGPFVLTFLVVVFILLMQHMLKYFDDIIGKDLGWDVLGTLLFYFAIFMTPIALPLAVLLSSLITYGNLGEHFELTAIKSLGISLIRSMAPIFVFVIFLTWIAFLANNYMVPKAALEAYSLLYDIKQKKPALDLKEGAFYSSIPDISIKVNHKFSDGNTLKGVIIYDHRGRNGNKDVTIADSGKMYTILNDQYLKLELFNGYNYSEGGNAGDPSVQVSNQETSNKTKFSETQVVFDLSSFGLNRTDKRWFQGNRIMHNLNELDVDMDSVAREITNQELGLYISQPNQFIYHFKKDSIETPKPLLDYKKWKDSVQISRNARDTVGRALRATFVPPQIARTKIPQNIEQKSVDRSDSLFKMEVLPWEIYSALGKARIVKSILQNHNAQYNNFKYEYRVFRIQWHKILAASMACIAMFLIGAPLGAIIKKGGLGIPVLMSILFFIIFYVLNLVGEKWARAETISIPLGIWGANLILFVIGMLFLRQARQDARLFDSDFYLVMIDKIKKWIGIKLKKPGL